jgi:thiol-disulfide isomerase/thioredoxin
MAKKARSTFGELPPRYTFFLNPYQDYRFTRCPLCEQPAKWRKFPLLIHIDPLFLMALNMHARFCPDCDLLIVHQDQLEAQLAAHLAEHDPSLIGNDYLVFGTVERQAWRENMQTPKPLDEMRKHIADFQAATTFKVQPAGWYPNR